jgi:hypothetical protein
MSMRSRTASGVPSTVRIAELQACREELERRAERERARAMRQRGAVEASHAREIDAIASRLAQVRAELRRIQAR